MCSDPEQTFVVKGQSQNPVKKKPCQEHIFFPCGPRSYLTSKKFVVKGMCRDLEPSF